MLKEFKNLSPAETQVMYEAIPLITILVAGADEDMDEVELAEAKRLADIRGFNNLGHIIAYYEHVTVNLAERINQLSQELPNEVVPRQAEIGQRLSKLNTIFPILPAPFAYLYYRDFKSFAHHIAEANGGFLRYMTIGPREAKVVDLPMVTPVPRPSEIDFPDLP
ncbi:hypothetical protein [Neolewinella antarctica]|uniref:Uncharacterized protein n=1 Tax=Neolewinella antarctica TaxID=442734 RepID=A0ABX0X776_9BACT|nr:hypothetical protein [Neolewinella antarctica]NJC24868.1 hypothetical protein [Neolewinella antarctica]